MPFETTSLFDALEVDQTTRRVASRRALALAHTRVDRCLGTFFRGAQSEEEFEARLALVQEDFTHYVDSAAQEVGYDAPQHIAASLLDHYRLAAQPVEFTKTPEEEEEDAEKTASRDPRTASPFDQSQSVTAPGQPSGKASVPPNGQMFSAPGVAPPVPNAATMQNPQAGGNAQIAPGQGVNQTQSFPGSNTLPVLPGMPEQAQYPNQLGLNQPQFTSSWHLVGNDPFGNDVSYGRNAMCRHCGMETPGNQLHNGLCARCAQAEASGMQAMSYSIPNVQQIGNGNSAHATATCPDCGGPMDTDRAGALACRNCGKSMRPGQHSASNWIQKAVPESHKGLLHEHLGIPEGEKISEHRLEEALHSDDAKIREEAQFAKNVQGLHHGAAQNPADQNDDASRMVTCPACGGDGKEAGVNECNKCAGSGKVHNFGGSTLDALDKSASWQVVLNKKGQVKKVADKDITGLGGPNPQIDKDKQTDDNPKKDLPEVLENDGRWPTKRKDITEPIKAENREVDGKPNHDLVEIGEKTTEREQLPSNKGDAGYDDGGVNKGPHTKTFDGNGQVDPVTHVVQTV